MANIALLSLSSSINLSELTRVAGAVQRQVNEHASCWSISGTITAYATPSDVPYDYQRVTIVSNHPNGHMGVHIGHDQANQPYALVSDDGEWSVTVSHEVLEMLVDPSFSAFVGGTLNNGQSVNFLKEICDPCQGNSYSVNGVSVSDFVTPAYYIAASPSSATFTYCGNIAAPFSVAPYGCLVWQDPSTGDFWAYVNTGASGQVQHLGQFDGGVGSMSLRCWADSRMRQRGYKPRGKQAKRLARARAEHDKAAQSAATRWLKEMANLYPAVVPTEYLQNSQ
ncbi:hypothetical protein [Burkholderia sp. AU31652]|uniref:hypothetical protein n=1 Tax=Burkholderia sp. AU31652 TaxID=2015354 RepID=UPI00117745E0|nr:hypothetical protein [Burkholderia sp. AU31652]